jgi:hypothetical protein
MEYTDIFVASTTANIKQAIQQAFEFNQFAIQWQSDFAGLATRGSKGKNIAFGAFAQYYEMEFQILTGPDNNLVLRLIRTTSGWAGGAIGAHKVKKQYAEIVDGLSNYFNTQGIYRGRNPQ